ncbi:MAG: hypothetical protein V7607_59 [Solirubrobacteraceae bacterium]
MNHAVPRIAALLLTAATISACGLAASRKPTSPAPGYLFSIPAASGSLA